MKLEWLGRYRKIIGILMKNGNLYSRVSTKRNTYEYGASVTALEWQVLEIVYEHDDEILNMAQLASMLGIAQSNFSKYVKTLCDLKLVEKYARRDNSKDIVLRLSEEGKKFYLARSSCMADDYQAAFETLRDVPDEYLEKFYDFLQAMNQNYARYLDKSYSVSDILTKIE